MGRHGKNPRTWTTVLGLVSAGLVLAAVIVLVAFYPQLGSHTVYPACQYTANHVTVTVEPAQDCNKIMSHVVADADTPWVLTKQVHGEEFAKLGNGADHVRIYESDNKPLAGALANSFQKMGWNPEVVEPSPSP
jgi:hypothetical protein